MTAALAIRFLLCWGVLAAAGLFVLWACLWGRRH